MHTIKLSKAKSMLSRDIRPKRRRSANPWRLPICTLWCEKQWTNLQKKEMKLCCYGKTLYVRYILDAMVMSPRSPATSPFFWVLIFNWNSQFYYWTWWKFYMLWVDLFQWAISEKLLCFQPVCCLLWVDICIS